jgi:3-hydroxybutyryl-CoA dehydrogenase
MNGGPNITVGIVGAGTMGQGIAQVCAASGMAVTLFDLKPEIVTAALQKISAATQQLTEKGKISEDQRKSIIQNIKGAMHHSDVAADFIIEAAAEDLPIKKKILNQLESAVSETAILLSNTSSISITQMGCDMKFPQRFAGLHFFNPAPLMKLVEVVKGTSTSSETIEKVWSFATSLGKHPVLVHDSPGFIVNRVARLYYVEALKILEEGVADHESIDKLMRNAGFRMGPFELMDLIGIDVNLSVTKSIFHSFQFESRFRPSRIQQQKVDAGTLGRKTGEGFYDYK